MIEINKDIIIRLKKGDKKAFEKIFWIFNPKIFNFINSLLFDKSISEDLTQNIFLKIWEHRENIDINKKFESYLFTIARNLVYDQTKNKLKKSIALNYIRDTEENKNELIENNIDADIIKNYLNQLLEQLPASRRKIFQLSRFKNLSNKEIAQELNISVRTVETQIYRTLKFLKTKLSNNTTIGFLLYLFINSN